MFCIHTYPHYGIISATVDVAIKKPKVMTMDFHGLSLRPLVVKGLIKLVVTARTLTADLQSGQLY